MSHCLCPQWEFTFPKNVLLPHWILALPVTHARLKQAGVPKADILCILNETRVMFPIPNCGKSINEWLLNRLIQIKNLDKQPCVFAPPSFSTVSPFYLLSASKSHEMAPIARTWWFERKESEMGNVEMVFQTVHSNRIDHPVSAPRCGIDQNLHLKQDVCLNTSSRCCCAAKWATCWEYDNAALWSAGRVQTKSRMEQTCFFWGGAERGIVWPHRSPMGFARSMC